MHIDQSIIDAATTLRHELHRYPELSGQEEQTAARIAYFLDRYGPTGIITGIGGHGLAAIFDSGKAGPAIMLRCELDALPIAETNQCDYLSTINGIGHKCGHDGHMSIVAGMAPLLHQQPLDQGRVILLFQPAEETGEGAARVIDDPQFKTLRPDVIIAAHNLPGYPTGTILLRHGIFAAASRGMIIRLKGETSHAAHPEDGRSPARAMAKIIEELELLPDRNTFNDFVLCTVVHARLGEPAFGVTPGAAEVLATLRSFRDDDMAAMMHQAESTSRALADKERLSISIDYTEVFPATVNDPNVVAAIERAALATALPVQRIAQPFRWSEDFGHFARVAQTALFGIGSGVSHVQLHHSAYDFPDEIIGAGIMVMKTAVDELIRERMTT